MWDSTSPPQEQLTNARHNGRLLLEITADPRYGPYGQDRLIRIWVVILAVQQKSRVVHFSSATQLLEFVRLPEGEVVAPLGALPGVLCFYVWLVWQSWTINGRPVSIPLLAEHALNEQLGCAEYCEARFFLRQVRTWLKRVKLLWPECPAAVSLDGCSVIVPVVEKKPGH